MPSVLLINFSGLVTESWSSQILISKNTICLTTSLVIWRLSVCQNSSSFFLVANQVKAWVLWEAPKVIFINKDGVDVCVISCLGQINRWHCHSVSQWFTKTKTKTKTKGKTKTTFYVLKKGEWVGSPKLPKWVKEKLCQADFFSDKWHFESQMYCLPSTGYKVVESMMAIWTV